MQAAGNANEFPSISAYCAFEVLVAGVRATDRASVIIKQSFCLGGVPSLTHLSGSYFHKAR